MVLQLFLRQGWYARAQRVLLHFCLSLYWSKLLLEMLRALLKLFLLILCLKPLLFKWFLSWPNRVFKDLSVEQIPLIPPRWCFIPTSALYWQTEKRRNRHFKRRFRVINNNSHIVVNLTSHQLTENETSLLSRGLNFCPVPGPITETKLSAELDNFTRSLRIKEHFGSKQVEGGDEVSSDSDSEDACDYRFVKKVNMSRNLVRTSLWYHLLKT